MSETANAPRPAKLSRAVILLLIGSIVGGCAVVPIAVGAAGGYAAIKYIENKAIRDYNASLRATYEAARSALAELGYPRPKQDIIGPTEAKLLAGNANVTIAQLPGDKVRVSVRVGTFNSADNRRRAALIHERIGNKLGLTFQPARR